MIIKLACEVAKIGYGTDLRINRSAHQAATSSAWGESVHDPSGRPCRRAARIG